MSKIHVRGFQNLGNTCYLNSCLQLLVHCDAFTKKIQTEELPLIQTCNELETFVKWIELQRSYIQSEEGKVVNPVDFVRSFIGYCHRHNPSFHMFHQNDTSEFLTMMLTIFHECFKHKQNLNIIGTPTTEEDFIANICYEFLKKEVAREYSYVSDVFTGIAYSKIVSDTTTRHVPELFTVLHIPAEGSTLEECMKLYCNTETLDGENKWYNEDTKTYEVATKQTSYWSFPEVMFIVLKRVTARMHKLTHKIEIPMEMELDDYPSQCKRKYRLTGVCNHYGSSYGGHYTANVLSRGKWYHCNDSSVQEMSVESDVVTEAAYCVMFVRE